MSQQDVNGAPRLVITSEGPWQNISVPLTGERMVVGRSDTADIQINDSCVSRTHALIDRSRGATLLTDLGSTGGTVVNGVRAISPLNLHDGDVVAFASILTRYEEPGMKNTQTFTPPAAAQPRSGVHFTAGEQSAQQLNNVGGDQYNHYLQTVHAQRESFLREIAASRTHARRLIWFGLLLVVVGFGAYAWMIVRFITRDVRRDDDFETRFNESWGAEIGGVPIGFIGAGVGCVGTLLMIIGIVLHVVSTSRRRRIDSQPVFVPGPPGRQFPPSTVR